MDVLKSVFVLTEMKNHKREIKRMLFVSKTFEPSAQYLVLERLFFELQKTVRKESRSVFGKISILDIAKKEV